MHVSLVHQNSPDIFEFLHPHWLCTCNDTWYLEQHPTCTSSLDKLGLVNHPSAVNGEMAPCLLRSSTSQKGVDITPVEYSIILVVFNQEDIIHEVVSRLLIHTKGSWEFIIVFDYCIDRSIEFVEKALLDHGCSFSSETHVYCDQIQNIRLIEQKTPLFETSSTNLGLQQSSGNFSILVQDDMLIKQDYWNAKLAGPVLAYDDVVGVSARCATSYKTWHDNDNIGLDCGTRRGAPCTFYVRDTCNRGPLLLKMRYVRMLRYFDEENFYLGWDEHDFFARAWHFHGLVAGFLPGIHFDHIAAQGGTRKSHIAKTTYLTSWTKWYRATRSDGGFIGSLNHQNESLHNEERKIPHHLCYPVQ